MKLIYAYLMICIVAPVLSNERSQPTERAEVCSVCMVKTKYVNMTPIWNI